MIPAKRFSNGWKKPYFMQTTERKQREVEIAKRILLSAIEETNRCPNMLSYAYLESERLILNSNPRSVIKDVRRHIPESLKHPEYRPKSAPHIRVQTNKQKDPYFYNRGYEKLVTRINSI